MSNTRLPFISYEAGVAELHKVGFEKLKSVLTGYPDDNFDSHIPNVFHTMSESWKRAYTIVYSMCTQRAPHNYSKELYELVTTECANVAHLFPPESQKRAVWIRLLEFWFKYLDRFYVQRLSLPELEEAMSDAMNARDVAIAKEKRRVYTRRLFRVLVRVIGILAYWRHCTAMPDGRAMQRAAKRFKALAGTDEEDAEGA